MAVRKSKKVRDPVETQIDLLESRNSFFLINQQQIKNQCRTFAKAAALACEGAAFAAS